MAVTKEHEDLSIISRGESLFQVGSFKYVGSVIDQTAQCSKELKARLGAARTSKKEIQSTPQNRCHFA